MLLVSCSVCGVLDSEPAGIVLLAPAWRKSLVGDEVSHMMQGARSAHPSVTMCIDSYLDILSLQRSDSSFFREILQQ
jgi:hypothetical protein